MGNLHKAAPDGAAIPDGKISFDEYLSHLPESKQKAHKVLTSLILFSWVLLLGTFFYGICNSLNATAIGETAVVSAWMAFFLSGALFALVLGVYALILKAIPPPPMGSSGNMYQSGQKAVLMGWFAIIAGVYTGILALVGLVYAQAGYFLLERWIYLAVGLGILACAVGIIAVVIQEKRAPVNTD